MGKAVEQFDLDEIYVEEGARPAPRSSASMEDVRKRGGPIEVIEAHEEARRRLLAGDEGLVAYEQTGSGEAPAYFWPVTREEAGERGSGRTLSLSAQSRTMTISSLRFHFKGGSSFSRLRPFGIEIRVGELPLRLEVGDTFTVIFPDDGLIQPS